MATGAIPVVFNAGGHKEIVRDGENGFLWESEMDLVKITKEIIVNKISVGGIKANAKEGSNKFSYEHFKENILRLLH